MQLDLTGAVRQIQEMVDVFLQRLPYLAVALLVFAIFYLAAKVLRGFHDQTEETDGDRRRQREGWPAGEGEVPSPRGVAAALRELPRALRHEGGTRGASDS